MGLENVTTTGTAYPWRDLALFYLMNSNFSLKELGMVGKPSGTTLDY